MKKNYEELTFHDDFMFCKVLQNNPDLCQELLELILGDEVGKLLEIDRQKPIEITADGRGVRFDVYAKDDRSTVYDIEMQNAKQPLLAKRARYAQSLMDLEQLERGDSFSELKRSYVIFICNFNLREDGLRHRYSFRNLCVEDPSIPLEDGTEKIFLCTESSEPNISPRMRSFLSYVAGNSPVDDFTQKLETAVGTAKKNPRWRKEYMDFRDYLEDAREEGRAEERKNTEREKRRAEKAEKELAAALARIAELEKD